MPAQDPASPARPRRRPATTTASTTRSSRARRTRTDAEPAVAPTAAAALSPEERHRRIAEAAYLRAAARGFAPGHELDDWLAAERELDAGR